MTLSEVIKRIDIHLPGNRFDNDMKTSWINEIEGKIFDEVVSKTFKPAGNKIRYATRDGAGNWRFSEAITEVDPEEIIPEEYEDVEDEETEAASCDPDYAMQIDPLNQRCCCRCTGNSSVYELVPYSYPKDADKQLICPDRFCDVYVHYVLAKIHQADSEIDNFNNEVINYDAAYKDYAAWSIRNFKRY